MQVSGIRPKAGQIAHLRIGKRTFEAANEGLIEIDVIAPEDKPEVIEFEVFLEMPASLDFNVISTNVIDRRKGAHYRNALSSGNYLFTHSSETTLLNPVAPKMFDEEGNGIFSFVLLDWIEWEGPIVSKDEQARRNGLIPENNASLEQVTSSKIFGATWRRPVADGELQPYLRFSKKRKLGESMNVPIKRPCLVFLPVTYLWWKEVEKPNPANHELASRVPFSVGSCLIPNFWQGEDRRTSLTLNHWRAK